MEPTIQGTTFGMSHASPNGQPIGCSARRIDVTLHKGDRVLVNVAPFIASPRRNREAVPCDVLEVDAVRVLVATRSPCRQVELWVEYRWIDEVLFRHELLGIGGSL